MNVSNPFEVVEVDHDEGIPGVDQSAPGIGRLAWLLQSTILYALLLAVLGTSGIGVGLTQLLILGALLQLPMTVRRMRNAGLRPLLPAILLVIPLVNLGVWILCLILPPGYSVSRKMDRAGRITGLLVLMAIMLPFFAIFAIRPSTTLIRPVRVAPPQ